MSFPYDFSIKNAAKTKSGVPLDLDNMRAKKYETNKETGFRVNFPAHSIYTLEKSNFSLLAHSQKVPFNITWTQRPDYASHALYGTEVYWFILMYVNNVFCIEEFKDFDTILVPPYLILMDIVRKRAGKNYTQIDDPATNLINLYKRYQLPEMKDIEVLLSGFIYEDLSNQTLEDTPTAPNQKIKSILTPQMLSDGGFIVGVLPDPDQNVVVTLGDYPVPLIPGRDYDFNRGTGQFCILNLSNIADAGDTVALEYIRNACGLNRGTDIDNDTSDDLYSTCCGEIEQYNCEKTVI